MLPRRRFRRRRDEPTLAPVASFLRLPTELLNEIVLLCADSRSDLVALLITCKRLLPIAASHVYETVVITCSLSMPVTPQVKHHFTSICSALLSDFDLGCFVQSLRIVDFRYVVTLFERPLVY